MKSLVSWVGVATCLMSAAALAGCGGRPSSPAPSLTITTGSLINGAVGTPYNQAIQVSGGVAPYNWTVSAGALPHSLALSPSGTNTSTISGVPDRAAQGEVFTLQVTDSAHQTASHTYTVSILLAADSITFSSVSLDFGVQVVGVASNRQAETVTNSSSSALAISSVGTTGTNAGDFVLTSTCGSNLPGGANCVIDVMFTPGQPGPRSAAITISDDSLGSPQSLALNGVGVNQGPNATLSASNLVFGTQIVDTTSAVQSLTLSNYGTTTLTFTGISASTNFGQTNNCGTNLGSGASCTVSLSFTPGATGDLSGTFSVNDNASGGQQVVTLSGTGIAGSCTPKDAECRPGTSCCMGLVCVAAGDRGRCEPSP